MDIDIGDTFPEKPSDVATEMPVSEQPVSSELSVGSEQAASSNLVPPLSTLSLSSELSVNPILPINTKVAPVYSEICIGAQVSESSETPIKKPRLCINTKIFRNPELAFYREPPECEQPVYYPFPVNSLPLADRPQVDYGPYKPLVDYELPVDYEPLDYNPQPNYNRQLDYHPPLGNKLSNDIKPSLKYELPDDIKPSLKYELPDDIKPQLDYKIPVDSKLSIKQDYDDYFKSEFGDYKDGIGYGEDIIPHENHDHSIHEHKIIDYTLPHGTFDINESPDSDEPLMGYTFSPTRTNPKCFSANTCCGVKKWTARQVLKVMKLESDFFRKSTILVRFPDTKMDENVVKQFHKSIRAVHYLQSPYSHHCYITLQANSNRSEVINAINNTPFGSGKMWATASFQEYAPSIEDIDPFTLFLDHVAYDCPKQTLTNIFRGSQQIAVGYTNKLYYMKRFAFSIYPKVKDAIKAFKRINTKCGVIVRFRRFNGASHLPCEADIRMGQGPNARPDKAMTDVGTYLPGSNFILDVDRTKHPLDLLTVSVRGDECKEEVVDEVFEKQETLNEFEILTQNLMLQREQERIIKKEEILSEELMFKQEGKMLKSEIVKEEFSWDDIKPVL